LKKFIASFLILFMFFTMVPLSQPAEAAAGNITVYVNDIRLQFDQPPILENGRTLVPMRAIFEELNCTVEWYESTQMIIAVTEFGVYITLEIGSNIMTVKHDVIYLDVPPKLVNGRTLVPVRAISEALGADVSWHEPSSSVFIFYRFIEGGDYLGWGDSSPYDDYLANPGNIQDYGDIYDDHDHYDGEGYDDEPIPPDYILQKYQLIKWNMPFDDVKEIFGPPEFSGKADEYSYHYYWYIDDYTLKVSVYKDTMKVSGSSIFLTSMSWKYVT